MSSLRPAGTTYLIVCYDYGQVMQDPVDTQPAPDTDIHFSAEAASRFLAAAGLVVDSASGTRVAGHIDLGPDHHTPWGVVHGGDYAVAFSVQAAVIAPPDHSALMISAAGQGRGFPPCCSSARVTTVRSCSPSP